MIKYIMLGIYIIIVCIIWTIHYYISTIREEKFVDDGKAFGTLLINTPIAKEQSTYFKTLDRPNLIPQDDDFYMKYLKKNSVHIEKFENVDENDPTKIKIKYKSFGTILKNVKQVNDLSKNFKTIRMKGPKLTLPTNFDGRQIWKNYLCPVKDQGSCGNCWAHASSSVLSDRFAILSLNQIKFNPSPAEITVCAKDYVVDDNIKISDVWGDISKLEKMDDKMHEDMSCNGNTLFNTAQILYTDGITTNECFPDKSNDPKYNVPDTEDAKKLPYCHLIEGKTFDMCIDGKTPMRKYRCQTAYNIPNVELAIMNEIYRLGPVVSGFLIYPDFMYSYDGKSIYTHSGGETEDKSMGGHAISIYGWGEEKVGEETIKYWIIKNSWGDDWGDHGFFKIKRGLKDCQIEENVLGMIPEFPGLTITDISVIPVETKQDLDNKMYTDHLLNAVYGYYKNILDDIVSCKLTVDSNIVPYISPLFKLPDYNTFIAGEITNYLNSNPIKNGTSLVPLKCNSKLEDGTIHALSKSTTPETIESTQPQSIEKGNFFLKYHILYSSLILFGSFAIYKFVPDYKLQPMNVISPIISPKSYVPI
jgi:C1A family cysteine protease